MKIVNFDRNELLKKLPKGIVAEIGVATGKYSRTILENNNPTELVLIDAWKNFDLGYKDGNMVSNEEHEKRYQSLNELANKHNNIKLIRKLSEEASKDFDDNYFDWVYIDADHSYNGCLDDLKAYDNKVKQDGYILGHDWLSNNKTKAGFGVNKAVEDFIKNKGYKLSFITNEDKFATYLISKTEKSHNRIMENV